MPTTPNITLTATLDDLTGAEAGSSTAPAKLRIALCGFGPTPPVIPGTAVLARVGPFDVLDSGAGISTALWGNDQITPSGTFYSIEILDARDNVVQCGAYTFTGSGTMDLSNAVPIIPPYGFPALRLAPAACTGAVPGSSYLAPGYVIAVYVNGLLQRPAVDYTSVGAVITLLYTTELGDNVYALCIF